MSISKIKRDIIYNNSKGICPICGREMIRSNINTKNTFTIDHIYPRSLGGSDDITNLRGLCGSCNSVRGNKAGHRRIDVIKSRKCVLDYEVKFIKDDIENGLIKYDDLCELEETLTSIYKNTLSKLNKLKRDINE